MTLQINIWNVDHGLAIHVRTPNGRFVAIDLGTLSVGRDHPFNPLMHEVLNGVRVIDRLIVTHPHFDHISGIHTLDHVDVKSLSRPRHLSRNKIESMLNMPAVGAERDALDKYHSLSERFNFPIGSSTDLENHSPADGSWIRTFVSNPKSDNINDHSVVTCIDAYGVKFLVPGDNEHTSWEYLLSDPTFLHSIQNTHVVIAPHHGRQSGFHPDLFASTGISPLLTVISDKSDVDSSAAARYSDVSRGWQVSYAGVPGTRKRLAVSTRNDGNIVLQASPPSAGKSIGGLDVTLGV